MKGHSLLWVLILCGQNLLAQFSTDAVFTKGDSIVYYSAETEEQLLIYRHFVDDIATDFDAGRLYLRTPDIVSSDLFGENLDTIRFENGGLFSLDGANNVFFSDQINTNILRLSSEDRSTSIVLNVGSTSITGSTIIDFEIDKSNSERLFLARQDPEEIQIWDLATQEMTNTIPATGIYSLVSVAETNQLFYLLNDGTNAPSIRVSDLDGENVQNVITSGLDDPLDLFINTIEKKLYWSEDGETLQGLYRANFDGSDIEKVSEDLITRLVFPVSERTNEAPAVIRSIPDMVLIAGYEQFQIDLDTIFDDDHTEDLFYLASGNPTSVVRFEADNNILTVIEVGTGTTTITISADDKEGGQTETSFMLTVEGILSADQFQSNASLLYPNPVQDHVNVITREKPTLMTLAGQQLRPRMQRTEQGWQVDLSKSSPGVYVMIVEGAPYRIIKRD